MCLITEQQEPLIAQEDMIVFKALRRYLRSMYEGFKYEIGKLYSTNIKEEKDQSLICCFDCIDCTFLSEKYEGWDYDLPEVLKCFSEGFHSVLFIERLDKYVPSYSIYECIIPKGSEYYTEPTGTVISNKIIITKKV